MVRTALGITGTGAANHYEPFRGTREQWPADAASRPGDDDGCFSS
jgi:hypothetical protein